MILSRGFRNSVRVAVALILIPLRLFAQSPPTDKQEVVIVSAKDCCPDAAWPEAEQMIAKELAVLGISVTLTNGMVGEESNRRKALTQTADEKGAAVAICILKTDDAVVEIWLADRMTEKVTVREWQTDDTERPDGALIAAVRTVETLRASLLEIRMKTASPKVPVDRNPPRRPKKMTQLAESTPIVPERRRTLAIGLGANIAGTDGSAGLRSGFELSVAWQPLIHMGMDASAVYLPFGKSVSAGGVTSKLDLLLFRGFILWHILDRSRFRPSLGLGGGGLAAFAKGTEGEGYDLQSDRTKIGYIAATARLAFMLREWLAVRLDFCAGILVPEFRLSHGETDAARMGRPLFEGSLKAVFYL